jgi:phosphohistidine phosphatase
VAEGLKRIAPAPEVIFSSPLDRAQETAQIMAATMGIARVDTSTSLAPDASPAVLRALLSSHSGLQGILLVGHHPDVTVWTSYLTGLDASASPLFGTASIAALQYDPNKKKADFLWFQTSEQLSQM